MGGGVRPLNETINYEEDKEISPEKDDEKPIYESTEGPIPKAKNNRIAVSGVGSSSNNRVGKSGNANMIMSGESFGISG